MKNLILTLVYTIIVTCITLAIAYDNKIRINTNEDKIIREDSKYMYVMTYKPFNEDSVVEKYHAPIYLKAKIIKVDSTEYTVYLQNIKTKQVFTICKNDYKYYENIHVKRLYYYPDKNKIYNFKYIFYPKNKEGYYIIP